MNHRLEEFPRDSKSKWLTRKIYETKAEKDKDFWTGVALFFGLNIVLGLCSWGLGMVINNMGYSVNGTNTQLANLYYAVSCILGLLPLLINIGLIIYFAFTRTQIGLGMVAGFGIVLAITVCLGMIFTAWCFYAFSGY